MASTEGGRTNIGRAAVLGLLFCLALLAVPALPGVVSVAHASGTDLQTWCNTNTNTGITPHADGSWNSATNTCTVTEPDVLYDSIELHVAAGQTLDLSALGAIITDGTAIINISARGTLSIESTNYVASSAASPSDCTITCRRGFGGVSVTPNERLSSSTIVLWSLGEIFNQGTISVSNTGDYGIVNMGTIDNQGSITVSSSSAEAGISNLLYHGSSGGTFTNHGAITVSSTGSGVGIFNNGTLTNYGSVALANSGSGTGILNDATMYNVEATPTTGTISISNTGDNHGVGFQNAGSFENYGPIKLTNGVCANCTGVINTGSIYNSNKITVSTKGYDNALTGYAFGIVNLGTITDGGLANLTVATKGTTIGLTNEGPFGNQGLLQNNQGSEIDNYNGGVISNSHEIVNHGAIYEFCNGVIRELSGGTFTGNPVETFCLATQTSVTPSPASVGAGGSITFTAKTTASGSSPAIEGDITWSDGGAGGTFSPSGCTTLTGTTSVSCTVSYTAPATTGPVTINATFSHDVYYFLNGASSGTSSLSVKASPTISTQLSSATVDAAQMVYDTATLSGATSTAGGTVTYEVYTSSSCAGAPTQVGLAVTVTNGVPGSSATQQLNVGYYGWEAIYSGDGANTGATSPCEPLTVNPDPTVAITSGPGVSFDQGQTATPLTASVAYLGSNPVTVEWYSSPTNLCGVTSTDTHVSGTSFIPSTAAEGETYYCAVVFDSAVPGYSSASFPTAVEVGPPLTLGALSSTTGPAVDAGQTTILQSDGAGGGPGPYVYSWTGLPPGCAPSGGPSVLCIPLYSTATSFTVTLTVTDSNHNSASQTLTLEVDPPLSLTPLTSSTGPAVDVGQSSDLASGGASGGSGSYTYTWIDLPQGCDSSNSPSITCTPTATDGTPLPVTLVVEDSNGNAETQTFVLAVDPALTISPLSSSTGAAVDVGQQTVLSSDGASGGTGSGTYVYEWSGLPSGCAGSPSTLTSCTPDSTSGTPLAVTLTVSDGNANSVSATFVLTVDPALAVPAPAATHDPADVGQSVTFTASPSGGSGVYTAYEWSGLPPGCTPSDAAMITCSPTTTVNSPFSVTVAVTDSNGNVVSGGALSFAVDPALLPGVLSSSSGNSIVVDQSTTLSTSGATGGSGAGTYAYSWTGLPTGCSTLDSASIQCTPTSSSGSPFAVTLSVTDANGNTVTATLALTVWTPQQATQSLIVTVSGMNLQHTVGQSLHAKLGAALASEDAGHSKTAINQMNAFINEVSAQAGKTLTQAQAQQLTADAESIIAALST